MKIAISSCGIFLDSPIDPRFGRSDYFVIIDTDDMRSEVFENKNIGLTQGAGVQSAQILIAKGAGVVIAGNVGPNAMRTLTNSGIEVFICHSGTIKEAVDAYKRGKLAHANNASVENHYGFVGKALRGHKRNEDRADD